MSRLIAVGVLLAVIISTCIVGAYKINGIYDEMNALVDNCENSQGDDRVKNTDLLVDCTEKYDNILTLFVRRDIVEDISENAKRLTAMHDDSSSYMAECVSVRHSLNEMKEEYTLNLKSIF